MDYYLEVIAYTKGKGSINYIYDGYDICHNTEEVIEEIGYDKMCIRDSFYNLIS